MIATHLWLAFYAARVTGSPKPIPFCAPPEEWRVLSQLQTAGPARRG